MRQGYLPEASQPEMSAVSCSLPLVIHDIMIAPDLALGQEILLCFFLLLLKGQQLCVALPLLLDGCLGSCFFLLLSVKNAPTASVMREEKAQVCVCRIQHGMPSAYVVLLALLAPHELPGPSS